ncbi:hypothetical protein EW026_g3062 [Hermanssonia centrifuga]|uniref:DUF6533 domain-containing protein n=1 Tax=Hermanssonia centrifuga TaxID=98765 RepID=A0A4S4KLA8_9APHY|nr:hypothetical protein EW026_g3062 [Hermanssonia centrifuga]
MSQTSVDAQIVAEFQSIVTDANIIYTMTALVAYEYVITLRQEMTMVWQRKWTLATWLFIANRYLLIGYTIWGAAPYTSSQQIYHTTAFFTADPIFGTFCDDIIDYSSARVNLDLITLSTYTY